MVKKIGNYIKILLFLGSFLLNGSELRLRVLTMKGKPTTELEVGTPYILEIKAEGSQDLYNITISGIEHCYHEFRGASHMDLMSHITTLHNYLIRFDKEGTFTLGPVLLPSGNNIQSNSIQVHVCSIQKAAEVTVELTISKKKVVAYETVQAKIIVNVAEGCQLLDIKIPSLDAGLGEFSILDKPIQGSRSHQGIMYKTFEWPLQITIKKEGELIIPSCPALCRIPVQHNRNTLFGFSFNMYGSHDQWYQSQPVSLQVDPLPCSYDEIDGIGIIDRCYQSIDHKQAHIGEGIVLRLVIEGRDGIPSTKAPRLNLGPSFKYYESKASLEKQGEHYKKTFEYIVQANKAGGLQIPAQTVVFFDTRTRALKEVTTQPLAITIMPDAAMQSQVADNYDNFDSITPQEDCLIYPIEQNSGWQPCKERSISSYLFFMIILLSLVVAFALQCFFYWSTTARAHKKRSFKFIKRKLALLKKKGDAAHLYETFIQLFAEYNNLSQGSINANSIQEILKKAGFVASTLEQWNRFFNQLCEYAFFKNTLDNQALQDIFKRASIWVNQLEEKL